MYPTLAVLAIFSPGLDPGKKILQTSGKLRYGLPRVSFEGILLASSGKPEATV